MTKVPREAWRPVVGHETTYSVSSLGRVRREAPGYGTRPGRILSAWPGTDGRLRVTLSTNNLRSVHPVHRLVAHAFLGPCPDGHEVNHVDGDRLNNEASNLEYVTRAENMAHAVKRGLTASGERHGHAYLSDARARRIRWLATRYDNRTIARRLGIGEGVVSRLVRGETYREAGGPIQPRQGRGSARRSVKLTEEKVVEARTRAAAGESLAAIARDYGVTDGAIRKAVRRETWRHV